MAYCEKHGEFESKEINILGVVLKSGCPKCDYAAEELKVLKYEAASKERFIAKCKKANIEPRYYFSTFENFKAETPEQKKALASMQRLVAGEVLKVVMTGNNGTGKTHLACSAIHLLGGKIYTMYEISTMIRASYTNLATKTELEIVEELASVELLVIDEIGRTKGSDTETNWLSYIIDKRHARDLRTIMITNKHLRKDCQKQGGCSDCLENYISEDIMSRLAENSVLLRFNGEDYRKIRKEAS